MGGVALHFGGGSAQLIAEDGVLEGGGGMREFAGSLRRPTLCQAVQNAGREGIAAAHPVDELAESAWLNLGGILAVGGETAQFLRAVLVLLVQGGRPAISCWEQPA